MRLSFAFWLLTLINFSAYCADTYPDVEKYVDSLVNQVSTMLHDSTTTEEIKVAKSRELLSNNLDLEWMGKYTLGRNRKTLDDTQLTTFLGIYSKYIIKNFSDLVKNYKGEKAIVKNVRQIDNNEFIVRTEIDKKNGQPPIKVDYLVHQMSDKKGVFKVSDVITEGVSMINTQRAEFNSILSNYDFDSLIGGLKKKI